MLKFLFKKLFYATKYSLSGLLFAIKTDASFRIELALSFFILPLAFYLGTTKIEIVLLSISWFIILITELINCAIESTIDRFKNDINEFFKHAKDLGSAAVFLAIINFLVIWFFVLAY